MKPFVIEPLEARIAPATIAFTTPTVTHNQTVGGTDYNFTVSVVGDDNSRNDSVTVDYATADGTTSHPGHAGTDYNSTMGTLVFVGTQDGAGTVVSTQNITVHVNGEPSGTPDFDFLLNLSNVQDVTNPGGTGVTLDPSTVNTSAHGIALNVDQHLSYTATTVSAAEGNGGTGVTPNMIALTVQIAQATTHDVIVHYSTYDATNDPNHLGLTAIGTSGATGQDFVGTNDSAVTIAAGQTTATILVPIIGDKAYGPDETFQVHLIDGTTLGATVDPNTDATAKITNDDGLDSNNVAQPPKITVTAPTGVVAKGADAVFHISDGIGYDYPVTVNYMVMDGTAHAGTNYTSPTMQSVVIPAGATGVDVHVTTAPSTNHTDPPLTFSLALSSAASSSTVINGVTVPAENATVIPPVDATSVTATIAGLVDDNLGIRFHAPTAPVLEGNAGDTTALFSITLDHPVPSGHTLTVFYHTAGSTVDGGGTATPGASAAGGDYTEITSGSVTFAAGQSAAFVPVTVHGDIAVEGGDETVKLVADFATYDTHDTKIAVNTATGTIKDDDGANTTLSVTAVNDTQFEGDGNPTAMTPTYGNAVYTVHLTAPLSHALVLNYNTTGGVASDGTVGPGTGMVTIPVGSTSATITVPYLADNASTPAMGGPVQPDHDVTVTLLDPMTAAGSTSPDAVAKLVVLDPNHAMAKTTIQDDDAVITVTGGSVAEGNTGDKNPIPFTFSLPDGVTLGHDVVITYTTSDGTATSTGTMADYTPQTNKTVVLKANTPSVTIDTVTTIGDALQGPDETVIVTMNSVTGAVLATTKTATSTITNDDTAVAPRFTITPGPNNGGAGSEGGNAVYTVTLDPTVPAFEVPLTLTYSLTGTGTHPTDASDFTNGATGTVVIAAGQTSATLSIPLAADLVPEAQESFNVTLTDLSIPGSDPMTPAHSTPVATPDGTLTAAGTIAPSDRPTLSVTGVTQLEGSGDNTFEFHINLSAALNHDVTIDYMTLGGTAVPDAGGVLHDYMGVNSHVTIPMGQTSAVVDVTVHGNTTPELDKTFNLQVAIASDSTGSTVLADTDSDVKIGNSSAIAKIQNDDTSFSIVREQDMVTPDGSQPFAKFLITRSDATVPASVSYSATTDLTLPSNFHLPSGVMVNFAMGQLSQEILVPVLSETSYQAAGHLTATLSSPVNAILDPSHTSDTVNVGQIAAPVVSITSPVGAIGEGGPGSMKPLTFTVHLNEVDNVGDVVVHYSTLGTLPDGLMLPKGVGGAIAGENFASIVDGTVTIPKGQTSATFTVNVIGNSIHNTSAVEAFFVHLNSADGGTVNNSLAAQYGTGLINDDDPVPKVSIGSSTIGQSGSAEAINFLVSLSNASDAEIMVPYHIVNGTAKLGTNFTGAASGMLDFQPGQTSATITLGVPGFGTNVPPAGGPDKVFHVVLDSKGLTDAKLNPQASSGTGVIRDDTAVAIAINDVSVTEGNPVNGKIVDMQASFTVSLTNPSSVPVTVHYTTVGGTGTGMATADADGQINDFKPVSGTVVFAPGQTTQTINVPVHGDNQQEPNETFTVQLSDAKNGTLVSSTGAANNVGIGTATIVNDDSTPTLSIADAHIVEGAAGSSTATLVFTPTLSSMSSTPVTFTISTGNIHGGLHNATAGSSATSNGADYVSKTTQTFTIPANAVTGGTFAVTVIGDGVFENAENLAVNITNISSNAVAGRTTAIGTILNDDIFYSAHEVKWTDPGGQIGDLKITKGTLSANNFQFTPDTTAGSIGGSTLTLMDIEAQSFLRTNITVTAKHDPGLPAGLGSAADVLQIGGIRSNNTTEVTEVNVSGVDLGNINIQGNLDSILAGDRYNDLGITSLHVKSFGAQNTSDNPSAVIAGIGALRVDGDFTGNLSVVGNQYGKIRSLVIGGALKGLASVVAETNANGTTLTDSSGNAVYPATGIISTSAGIVSATIGSIGDAATKGANSASLLAASIGTLHVKGSITGGVGAASASVFSATSIGKVLVDGDINLGGGVKFITDTSTGTISPTDTASIIASTSIGSAKIGGSIVGGTVAAGKAIAQITVTGDLDYGGSGTGSPAIISAGGFQQTSSGSILEVVALPSVIVHGDVAGGKLLAGYSISNTPLNADAHIGKVQVDGNVMDFDVVAGASAGSDSYFGDTNDTFIQTSSTVAGVLNSPSITSRIATVIIGGSILPSTAGTHHGIVSQEVDSLTVGGVVKTIAKTLEYAQIGAATGFFIADIGISSSMTPDQIDA